MAKARSLVGLGVHATKFVAVVLDAEASELAYVAGRAEIGRFVTPPVTKHFRYRFLVRRG